jgi:nicotinic acid mononucleotide adenylyltransferase
MYAFRCLAIALLTVAGSLQALVLENLIESNRLSDTFHGKTVGYYTGSFDPIHRGHAGFAEGVVEAGYCDYVLIVPAWGGDGFKERAPVSIRLEMLHALFAQHPRVIVTQLSPLDVQQALTKITPDRSIRGYPTVEPQDSSVEFVGLIGSDTALNLVIPAKNEKDELNRKKRLQVFMQGVAIPERYADTSTGSIMALPVSRFIVGLREGDELSILNWMIGERSISAVYRNEHGSGASSTLVKQRLKNGEAVDELIEPEVLSIIEKYNLWMDPTL